jgi:hypothetical protein
MVIAASTVNLQVGARRLRRLKQIIRRRMLALVESVAFSGDRVARRPTWPGGNAVRHARRAVVWARLGIAAVLLGFHVALFWSHLDTGRLFEPGVALRWSIGVVLLGLLVGLRRVGVPVLWGRRALVVWVLVALLHVNAAAPATSDSFTTASPAELALTLVVLPPAAGIVFAAGLLLLTTLLARAWRLEAPAAGLARPVRATRLRSQVHVAGLASRAPPVPTSC